MALGDLILGETARAQEIMERPSLLLREDKAARTGQKLARASLRKSEQEFEQSEKRFTTEQKEAASALTERQEIIRGRKLDNMNKAAAVSNGVPRQTMEQMVHLNNLAVGGDTSAAQQRDNMVRGIFSDPNMVAAIGAHPAMTGLLSLDYDTYLAQPPEERQKFFAMIPQAYANYDRIEKERLLRDGATSVILKRKMSEAEAEGEAFGEARGKFKAVDQGILSRSSERSEGQQAKVQGTYGSYLTGTVLKAMGENAGRFFFDKDLTDNGQFATDVRNMPTEQFVLDAPEFEDVLSVLLNPEWNKGKTDKEKNELIDQVLAGAPAGTLAPQSPFRIKLAELKKVKLANMKDAAPFKKAPLSTL